MNRAAMTVSSRRFRKKAVTLYRPTLGTPVNGVMPAPTYADPVTLQMICQPAGGDDLELLDEGQRLNNVQAVWSTVPLRTGNGKDSDADVLEIDGVKYTVIKAFNRADNGFYKVLAEGYVDG